eukprot:NODE_132_length_18298_cov_0.443101.p6 type:complete len:279 gc:universal NODE_132_length_18298_cov_0.443101:13531-12695(-)
MNANLSKIVEKFIKAKHPLIICGAGVSTESNIPDYRGEKGAYKINKRFIPITLQSFMKDEKNRKRYWLRSFIGWDTIKNAVPNDSHFNITRLQYLGGKIITQNVDGLHQKAGSDPLELHGTLHRVQCLGCDEIIERTTFQKQLLSLNPELGSFDWHNRVNPDGDAEIELDSYEFMTVPSCANCGGILKPKVVFFGENIDLNTRAAADNLLDNSDFLLVIGSTLTTYSAYRFLLKLKAENYFSACINLGATRGDELFDVKINSPMFEPLLSIVNKITHQ